MEKRGPDCRSPSDFKLYDLGVLGENDTAAIRAHLEVCPICQDAYEQQQLDRDEKVDALAQTESVEDVPAHRMDPASVTRSDRKSRPNVAKRYPKIDGYRITGVLGQGGMGIVYQAVQTKLNRTVALKVLPAIVSTANPSSVSRFRREATAAARLHHTNIIPIYDYGQSRDGYYYAMEVITGQPLNVLIQRFAEHDASSCSPARLTEILTSLDIPGALITNVHDSGIMARGESTITTSMSGGSRIYHRQVARWMADAADALQYAHDQGIIHRDIKPSNLILSVDGRIMVADFGLAKTEDEGSVTMTGAFLGSLRYVSPEQAMAKRVRVDHRTDIYSLGVTMYELLCFKPAFPGTDDKQVLGAIIASEPTPPRKIHHAVPGELDIICLKCMEKSPEARYPNAREMADDLRRFINDLPIVAKRPGPVTRTFKFVRRRKAPVIAVTAVILLSLTGLFAVKQLKAQRLATAAKRLEEAEKLAEKAKSRKMTGEWDFAYEDLRQALAIAPDNLKALQTLAWIKLAHYRTDPNTAGNQALEAAAEASQRIVELDPTDVQAWNFLGVALRRLGRYDEAIDALERAVEVFGESEQAQQDKNAGYAAISNLGVLYIISGDPGRAESLVLEATDVAGVREDPWRGDVWRNLAVYELHVGKQQAVEHIDKAIQCNRFNALSWVVKALIHLQLDGHIDPSQALDAAKIADNNANREDAKAKRVLGLAHLRNNDPEAAIEAAQEAIQLGDFPVFNHLLLAAAYARQRRPIKAREHLAEAEGDWPEDLANPGDFRAMPGAGELWIESADVLLRLRDEARALLNPNPTEAPPP